MVPLPTPINLSDGRNSHSSCIPMPPSPSSHLLQLQIQPASKDQVTILVTTLGDYTTGSRDAQCCAKNTLVLGNPCHGTYSTCEISASSHERWAGDLAKHWLHLESGAEMQAREARFWSPHPSASRSTSRPNQHKEYAPNKYVGSTVPLA